MTEPSNSRQLPPSPRPAPVWRRGLAVLRAVARAAVQAPVGWPGVFAGLAAVVLVRTVLELLLGSEHTLLYHDGTYLDLLAYANAFVSWLVTALLLICLVGPFLRLDSLPAARLVCSLLLVCWIVPLVNLWASGGGAEIYYGTGADDFLYNLIHLFDPTVEIAMAPAGVRVEIFLVLVACVVGAPLAFRISPLRGLALGATVYLAIFALGYLPVLYRGLTARLPQPWAWEPVTMEGYFVMYLPPLVLLAGVLVARLRREGSLASGHLAWALYPSRLAFYLYLALFGFVHASSRTGPWTEVLAPLPLLRFASLALSLALLFAWARIENDVWDLAIDRRSNPLRPIASGVLSPSVARRHAAMCLALSLLLVVPAGAHALPLWGLIAAACHAYSAPPLRLRRFYPLGHLVLAGVGLASFALGAALAQGRGLFAYLSGEAPVVALYAAFFTLSHLKDLKDVEGDTAAGVLNIFAKPRARRPLALLCLLSFGVAVAFVLGAVGLWAPMPAALLVAAVAAGLAWLLRLDDLARADRVFLPVLAVAGLLSLVWLARNLGG